MSKQVSQFVEGQVFYHVAKNVYMEITGKEWINTIRGGSKSKVKKGDTEVFEWLYECRYLTDECSPRRYYESRLTNEEFLEANRNSPFVIKLLALYSDKELKEAS